MKPTKLAVWFCTTRKISLSITLFVAVVVSRVPAALLYVGSNNATPAFPYSDWSTAAANIQDAVDAALPGDLILVTNGVYQTGARSLDASTTNRVVINKAVAVQSVNGAAVTLIDGGGVLRCAYLSGGARLAGFTLANGATSGNGGGIYCETAGESVSNCVLVANSAGVGGGAFGGSLSDCALTGNSAWTSGGGAASNNLFNCLVLRNSGGGAGGMSGCMASNCVIGGNSVFGGGGGAVQCTLIRCILTNNLAWGFQGSGGGALLSALDACVLSGNRADYGGGAASSTLKNCALWANAAQGGGGADSCTLNNCVLSGNGAVYYAAGVLNCSLTNSIVYFNTTEWGGSYNSYNSVLDHSCTTPLPDGVGNITNAPQFVDQPAGDLHLQPDSPCINAGNNSYVTSATDLDGNPRIVQGTVDMGAYEFQSLAPFVLIQSDCGNTIPGVPLNFSRAIVRGNVSETFWDFGDGTAASNQPAVSHAWAAAGDFQVIFSASGSDGTGSATSMVHVATAQVQPAEQTVFVGDNASFTTASELPQMGWQWLFNGTNISGATNNVLTLRNLQTNQTGNYSAVVTLNPPGGYPPGPHLVAASNALLIVRALATNTILYVDANGTNATWPYADWSTAALTIQEAAHVAAPGALILVNDGVYQTGAQTADGVTTNRLTVTKALTLQSLHGPGPTLIDGGGAIRCAYLADGARLMGFTLTNGFSSANGGGAFCETTNVILSNCVITRCFAAIGGGLYGGRAIDSAITYCGSNGITAGGGCANSTLLNCLIKNNQASRAGGASASTLVGCAVIGNTASDSAGGLENCSASYCSVSGNTAQGFYQGYGYGGGTLWCTLANCLVSGNMAQSGYSCCQAQGGGMWEGTATGCIIQGN